MLFPSNTPNGRRLKVAKTELIRHINPKISFNTNDSKNTNKYKKNVMLAINKFANGPANAIFPILIHIVNDVKLPCFQAVLG